MLGGNLIPFPKPGNGLSVQHWSGCIHNLIVSNSSLTLIEAAFDFYQLAVINAASANFEQSNRNTEKEKGVRKQLYGLSIKKIIPNYSCPSGTLPLFSFEKWLFLKMNYPCFKGSTSLLDLG